MVIANVKLYTLVYEDDSFESCSGSYKIMILWFLLFFVCCFSN
jgi:hypothetical protein